MSVTIKDIARELGVSPATVSLALNGSSMIGQETTRRVKEAAERMGYVRNPYARSLVKGRTGVLRLVVAELRTPFYATLVQDISRAAQEKGYEVSVAVSDDQGATEWANMRRLVQHRVEGIMLSPVNTMPRDPAYMRWLREMDVPMVFAGSRYVEVDAPFVTLDIYGGMLDLTRRLAAQGNRKFVLLSGAEGVDTMDQRVAGFRAGLAEAGLAGQVWYTGDTGYESAYRRVLEAPREELPQVFMCINDLMALAAMNALARRGLRVPEDVGVAGFDDGVFAQVSPVSLTTVHLDLSALTGAILEAMLRRLNGERAYPATIPSQAILRRSTEKTESKN